jgi:hypothetical protein
MRTSSGYRLAADDDRSAQAEADMREHLPRAVAEIAGTEKRTSVCALRGREVSQSVVVAYLIKHRGMDLDAAIRYGVQARRSSTSTTSWASCRLLSLGQGIVAECTVACEFRVETMTQNIVMYVYFNTQIKSYTLLEETRSFSSS